MRRAARPLNPKAAAAADEEIYRRHEGDPRPNALFDAHGRRKALDPSDPDQEGLRLEWLGLYKENGGRLRSSDDGNQRAPGSAVQPCPFQWVKFRVLDDKTGEPVPGVQLIMGWPSGKKTVQATDADGLVSIQPAEPGAYNVASGLEGAVYATTYEFLSAATSPVKAAPTGTKRPVAGEAQEDAARPAPRRSCIANITKHKVQTGESLDSIAKKNGLTWKALAYFNWETADPRQINKRLRDDVGCTRRAKDRYNYIFTSDAVPGIVYVPKQWEQKGLASCNTHTFRVKEDDEFLIILENDLGLRIPEADYEAKLADGSVRKGILGRNGVARIHNPPPGNVELRFPNLDDVEAKSLAACAREAFDERNPFEIYRVLQHSQELLKAVLQAYRAYFNDHTGKGLVEDIYQEITDPEALMAVEGLLARAGLPTHSRITYFRWDAEKELEDEVDDLSGAST